MEPFTGTLVLNLVAPLKGIWKPSWRTEAARIYIPLPEEAARVRMLEHFLKEYRDAALGCEVQGLWFNRVYLDPHGVSLISATDES